MTSFNKRIYEMLLRVQMFSERFPQLFPANSVTADLVKVIDSARLKMAHQQATQLIGDNDAKNLTGVRSKARQELKEQLEALCFTAKGLSLPSFRIPRDRGDLPMVAAARLLAHRVEPLKSAFIESHMPLDFIEQLKQAADILEKAVNEQTFHETVRVRATQGIDEARNAALTAVERLSSVLDNILKGDSLTQRAWQSVRHIERYSAPRSKSAGATEKPETTADNPPKPAADIVPVN